MTLPTFTENNIATAFARPAEPELQLYDEWEHIWALFVEGLLKASLPKVSGIEVFCPREMSGRRMAVRAITEMASSKREQHACHTARQGL